MDKNRIKTLYYCLSILLLVGVIAILAYTIPNHILEKITMQECAQTPGCMFCLPKWVGGGALINYCISGIMIFVCFIIFFKGKKINKTEEEVQE